MENEIVPEENKKGKNIALGLGLSLTVAMILVAWLNTTAMPVVLNTALVGLVVGCLALLLTGVGLYRSLTNPDKFRGTRTGVFLIAIVIILSGWFFYDGFLFYRAEEVQFQNGDITLAGTLYLPTSGCPCPAAVFIHGSGRQTRNEFQYYARVLAQNGIISLVYDKRGTGSSTGNLYQAGYREYAKDALAGVNILQQRPDVLNDKTGFIGFSEGEWVAPLAYVQAEEKPGFIIVVGPSGLSPAGQVNTEIELRLRSGGFGEEAVQKALSVNNLVFHFQRTGEEHDSLLVVLQQVHEETWFTAANDIPANDDELGVYDHYTWWRGVMDTDPDSLWKQVDAPVLFLKGELDDRSYADVAERNLITVLEKGGNTDTDFVRFPRADHMILEWPFGKGVPPPVFSAGYLDRMVEWIKSG
jgi:uncharacterized protein